jgi:[ribosomal protein S18]-alanine N-acetyltransferase
MNRIAAYIRWMIRRDMDEVLAIENEQFEFPWSEESFTKTLRAKNCIGMVAEHDDKIVGFMIYELHKKELRILNFAVAKNCERRGVGSAMARKLIDKLSEQGRCRILMEIRESNLNAQLFLRACGFRAVSVLRNFYEETDEAAFVFRYRVGDGVQPCLAERQSSTA